MSDFKLKVKWVPQEGVGSEWFNLEVRISNPTEKNIYVHLELPVLIDIKQNQIAADQWGAEEFVSGLIYAGATIKTNAMFKSNRVGERPMGGKVFVTYHERDDTPKTFHISARLKGEACYFVTYCYGRGSREYELMMDYRDHVLSQNRLGRMLISFYYILSPVVVHLAFRYQLFDRLIRYVTRQFVLKKIHF